MLRKDDIQADGKKSAFYDFFRWNSRGMGIILGLISSAVFGLIPLFTLPLMADGIPPESSLFYRFLIAAFVTFFIVHWRGERLALPPHTLFPLILTAFLYGGAALFLFMAYKHLPSGIAATIFFIYPILVMLIMVFFCGEKFSWSAFCSSLLALCGVGLLSYTSGKGSMPSPSVAKGIIFSLSSALTCALYMVSLGRTRKHIPNGLSLLLYLFIFSAAFILPYTWASGTFALLTQWKDIALAVMLSLTTAIVSNITLIWAVERIGVTFSSILGAMEPLTCVIIGILVFNEPGTFSVFAGVALIIIAVCLIIIAPWIQSRHILRRIQHTGKQKSPHKTL